MKKLLIIISMFLCMTATVYANYTTATVISNELQNDGKTRIVVSFSGDAGEPIVLREYFIPSNGTMKLARQWTYTTLVELNTMRTASTLPGLQVGQIINPLNPSIAPTAMEVWFGKYRQYLSMKIAVDSGILLSTNTEFVNLKNDVITTYDPSYASGF